MPLNFEVEPETAVNAANAKRTAKESSAEPSSKKRTGRANVWQYVEEDFKTIVEKYQPEVDAEKALLFLKVMTSIMVRFSQKAVHCLDELYPDASSASDSAADSMGIMRLEPFYLDETEECHAKKYQGYYLMMLMQYFFSVPVTVYSDHIRSIDAESHTMNTFKQFRGEVLLVLSKHFTFKQGKASVLGKDSKDSLPGDSLAFKNYRKAISTIKKQNAMNEYTFSFNAEIDSKMSKYFSPEKIHELDTNCTTLDTLWEAIAEDHSNYQKIVGAIWALIDVPTKRKIIKTDPNWLESEVNNDDDEDDDDEEALSAPLRAASPGIAEHFD